MADNYWEEPDALEGQESIAEVVKVASRFSLHVEGMPLIYNLMLAEQRRERFGDEDDRVGKYIGDCAKWAAREDNEEEAFNPDSLWNLLESRGSRIKPRLKRFVEDWTSKLSLTGAENASTDRSVRDLIADRELILKGRQRARLVSGDRLLDWAGESGVGRMDFNWFRAREFLAELKKGLA